MPQFGELIAGIRPVLPDGGKALRLVPSAPRRLTSTTARRGPKVSAGEHARLGLKQIEYFRAVMEAGTVSGAAALLHTSQPNVSRMLKYMESKLALRLFERHKGRLCPTPEACALFKEVQSLHRHLESLQESVRRIAAGECGRLRIGSSPSLGRFVVPRLVAQLRREMPGLGLKLDVLSATQVIDYLVFGEGDCACTISPIRHPLVASEGFSEGGLACVVPVGHRLATHAQPVSASDLSGESIIGYSPQTCHWEVLREFFAESAVTPLYGSTVRTAATACALAEQGEGIALVDEFTVCGNAFPSLVALPVQFRKPFQIHLHRLAGEPMSRPGECFRDSLRSWTTPK